MKATSRKRPAFAKESKLPAPGKERYRLRLYVTGATEKSSRAISNIKAVCEEHLKGRYDLEVVDVYQQPKDMKADEVIAIPTLIKQLPAPLRRLVGDLSDKERVLVGLDIRKR